MPKLLRLLLYRLVPVLDVRTCQDSLQLAQSVWITRYQIFMRLQQDLYPLRCAMYMDRKGNY